MTKKQLFISGKLSPKITLDSLMSSKLKFDNPLFRLFGLNWLNEYFKHLSCVEKL